VLLAMNGVFWGRGRLELRPSFTHENNVRYIGLGNDSFALRPEVAARDLYTRTHPALSVRARLPLRGALQLLAGMLYTQVWVDYGPLSNIERDLTVGSTQVKELLVVDRAAGLNLFEGGLLFDTRDNELNPGAGQAHQIKVRVCPWGVHYIPYRYVQIDAIARGYRSVADGLVVLAARVVGDLQAGSVPFYELSRYEESSALGGANGVRGVPSDRFYGKRKIFGNFEARASLLHFVARNSHYELGVTGFFDAGRVWAADGPAPELDGFGIGLKYGIGGGLRLRKGETFVLRGDLAWSPDARPIGIYLLAGHMF
jgi:outer membrane protein assembly factor BamA